jgi:hypothetical protein
MILSKSIVFKNGIKACDANGWLRLGSRATAALLPSRTSLA